MGHTPLRRTSCRFHIHADDPCRIDPKWQTTGTEHINVLGRYSFAVAEAASRGELRPLRTVNES